jgi:hypothetical protein
MPKPEKNKKLVYPEYTPKELTNGLIHAVLSAGKNFDPNRALAAIKAIDAEANKIRTDSNAKIVDDVIRRKGEK